MGCSDRLHAGESLILAFIPIPRFDNARLFVGKTTPIAPRHFLARRRALQSRNKRKRAYPNTTRLKAPFVNRSRMRNDTTNSHANAAQVSFLFLLRVKTHNHKRHPIDTENREREANLFPTIFSRRRIFFLRAFLSYQLVKHCVAISAAVHPPLRYRTKNTDQLSPAAGNLALQPFPAPAVSRRPFFTFGPLRITLQPENPRHPPSDAGADFCCSLGGPW